MAFYLSGETITTEGDHKFVVPDGYKLRKDLIYEYAGPKSSRKASIFLVMGRSEAEDKEERTRIYCGSSDCTDHEGYAASVAQKDKGYSTSCRNHRKAHHQTPQAHEMIKTFFFLILFPSKRLFRLQSVIITLPHASPHPE